MRIVPLSLLLLSLGVVCSGSAGCSSDDDDAGGDPTPASTVNGSPQPAPTGTTPGSVTPPGPTPGADDPGPAPPGCGTLTKDKDGFFTRTTPQSSYVGFVPKSYAGKPTMLVVAIHGCG